MKPPNFLLNRIPPNQPASAPPVPKPPRRAYPRRYNLDTVYSFLVQFKKDHDGASPVLREIMDACNISSTSVASYILERLARERRIEILPSGRKLRIRIPGARWVPPPNS